MTAVVGVYENPLQLLQRSLNFGVLLVTGLSNAFIGKQLEIQLGHIHE